jgi:preprotein translocase subunit SecY
MYSGGWNNIIESILSGIIPFINASILVDLLTALFPFFRKNYNRKKVGRRKLTFIKGFNFHLCCYSKWILIFYLKAYFYNTNLAFIASELVCGADYCLVK